MVSAVSVAITVKDEAASIETLLHSLGRQTRPPDEIVIVDGGSTDGTLGIIEAAGPPVRAISAPDSNISEGRNIAIRAARYNVILVTDAGVSLPDVWVEALTDPFTADESLAMVGGFFESAPQSVFEWALGATTLPRENEVDPTTFMPSHRSVAFRRSVWESLGGYPEWLDYCEDLLFDMRARAEGFRVSFEPRATVAFRPRSTLRAFALQYFRYARGDGKARILLKRHIIRYGVYGWATIASGIVLRYPRLRAVILGSATLFAGMYCRRPWARLLATRAGHSTMELVEAVTLVPVLRLTGDVAKMAGFPMGLAWACRVGRAERPRRGDTLTSG
jgi:glycosyltransferase involved in cell wall biosynthesis